MRDNAMPIIKTYVGADGRTLTFTCKKDGDAYNLTGLTLYLIGCLGSVDGEQVFDEVEMTVETPSTGIATYTPTAEELIAANAGLVVCVIKMVNGSNEVDFSEKFGVEIEKVPTGSS